MHGSKEFSSKFKGLLWTFALFCCAILLKAAHLAIYEHSFWEREALKPQKTSRILTAPRGEIIDRYGTVLAQNKLVYNAAIYYQEILKLPNKKAHIEKLSRFIASSLGLEADWVEDEIHAKAAQNPLAPHIIKRHLSESEFSKLKMYERLWPGLIAETSYERTYPKGKLMGSVIGYLGAIDANTYQSILKEIKDLEETLSLYEQGLEPDLPQQLPTVALAKNHLKNLQRKAYSFRDLVGKVGLEKAYDEQLRGFCGREFFDVDSKGRLKCSRSETKMPIAGKTLKLSISAELQEHAEKLLIENEHLRAHKNTYYNSEKACLLPLKDPWIKGGAIIAIDPKTGEIVALASHPRFDPNDFVQSALEKHAPPSLSENFAKKRIHKWLEDEYYLASVWDQNSPLEKELLVKDKIIEEPYFLTWELFINQILPPHSRIRQALEKVHNLGEAVAISQKLYEIEKASGISRKEILEKDLDNPIFNEHNKEHSSAQPSSLLSCLKNLKTPYERVLFIDLLELCVNTESFDPLLIKEVYKRSLAQHFQDTKNFLALLDFVKKRAKNTFQTQSFLPWKKKHAKSFLQQKRKEEKAKNTYARPYTQYLNEKENALFNTFWHAHKETLVSYFLHSNPKFDEQLSPYYSAIDIWKKELFDGAHKGLYWTSSYERLSNFLDTLSFETATSYLRTLRSFAELNSEILGHYPGLKGRMQKHLALSFYPTYGCGFMTHRAFQSTTAPGSVFKLVSAYAGLMHQWEKGMKDLNPLTIIDKHLKDAHGKSFVSVATTINSKPYPRLYKGGRLIQSARSSIGKIDLAGALAQTSNPYFSILCSDVLDSPDEFLNAATSFGFGQTLGIDLPFEASGALPYDLTTNPSGLYATAIGQHTVAASALQAASMLSAIATQGKMITPHVAQSLSGMNPFKAPQYEMAQTNFRHKNLLSRIGVDFPLFSNYESLEESTSYMPYQEKTIPMPDKVREQLIEGMRQVVQDPRGTAHPSLITTLSRKGSVYQSYVKLLPQIVGKTSTAEVVATHSLEEKEKGKIYKNVWFAGISFKDAPKSFNNPELVVVVFLPYGSGGKEPAPLMASVIEKWREIDSWNQAQNK